MVMRKEGKLFLRLLELVFNFCAVQTDNLFTVGDIWQVQLQAKRVVPSCCHSAREQIKRPINRFMRALERVAKAVKKINK